MEAEFQDYEKNKKWRKIYRNMNAMSDVYSNKDARKVENRSLNRYTDVVPYDDHRVRLQRDRLDYINASLVCVPSANRKYILTQGPLPNTSGHMWLMVWEQNSRAILMLNNLIECGHVKCHKYWPDGEPNSDESKIVFIDVRLRVELISLEKFSFYILRKFKLFDFDSETSREILHFHYTHWPDFDLPKSSDSFLEFLYAVRDSHSLDIEKYGPSVIHCSAGIGRSGTFVLVDSCLVMIENNKCRDSINIIDVLLEMRKYRVGLIQTPEQLRFSFLSIIEGSKNVTREVTPPTAAATTTTTNDWQPSPIPIQRSFGVNEEDEDSGSESVDESQALLLDDAEEVASNNNSTTTLPTTTTDNISPELRERKKEREEKRLKTLETINRIKRKQKEVEERLKFNQKVYKYFKSFMICFGVIVCVGVVVYYKRRDSILVNYE